MLNEPERDTKSALIAALSSAGDRYGNVLLAFMERYGLHNLMEATVAQLREFAAAGHYIK